MAGVYALQQWGLPALCLWDVIMGVQNVLHVHEDNKAMIQVAKTGRNPTMRYLNRTHRISISWLHEVCSSSQVNLQYAETDDMAADIYTKAYTNVAKWQAVCLMINMVTPKSIMELFER